MRSSIARFAAPCALAALVGGVSDLAALEGDGHQYRARVTPGLWYAGLGGNILYQAGGSIGDSFDVSDLDLDEDEAGIVIEGAVRLPILFNIYAGVATFGTDGVGQFSESITFGDQTYSAGVDVAAEFDLTDIYGELAWRVVDTGMATVTLGLAVHSISAETSLQQGGISENVDESIFIPAVAARAFASPLDWLSLEARVHWLSADVSDVEVDYLDVYAGATIFPIDHIGVTLGWRATTYDIDVEISGDELGQIDLDLGGPFLGGTLQF